MRAKVCFVYPWATLGGCERVFLNRALAFRHYLPDMRVDFCFLHDSGGLNAFASAIEKYDLSAIASIVPSLKENYDFVSLVDCPQAINVCVRRSQRYIVECHTGYEGNRLYLSNLPNTCEQVVTPSPSFTGVIRNQFPSMSVSVSELRNFVPWDITSMEHMTSNCLPPWRRKPILFFGRLDHLKDPLSLLDAFQIIERRRQGEFMLLLCGPRSPEIDLDHEIASRSLNGQTVVLPPIPFASAGQLLTSVANSGGVFVSPSRSESFGLSAAEAISSLLPVILSDIKAHADLVRGYESMFTYPLGNVERLAARIEAVFDKYPAACDALSAIRAEFSAIAFIEDWKALLDKLGFIK